MTNEIDRIQNAIRHIQTSVDIDPWAMEIAVKAMTKQMKDLKNSQTQMSGTSDLISRQDAIDAVYISSGTGTALKAIKALPSAQPKRQWIPVNLQNNSPEENKVVLLGVRFRDDFKYFVTSRQDYNYWTGLGREINMGELRWQPLPEPYKESEG